MAAVITPSVPAEWALDPADLPDESQLVTEDGQPVDNIFCEKQMHLLTEPLYANWAGPTGDHRFIVLSDVGYFAAPKDPPLAPDVMLSVNVDVSPQEVRDLKSYFHWRFGKTPDVVIEVVSNTKGDEDTTMLATYARWGIPYYVIYDPDHYLGDEVLRAYTLVGREYEPKPDQWFSGTGIGLTLWEGTFEGVSGVWLRWCHRNGSLIPTGTESANAALQRADAEARRANAEAKRADAEAQRAERYRAALLASWIDPDTL